MHAKTFVVDGAWSAVGTMNFDNRSLAYNDEVALVTLDGTVGAIMDSLYIEDLRFADEIGLDAFRRRPRWQRVLERAASVLASVLYGYSASGPPQRFYTTQEERDDTLEGDTSWHGLRQTGSGW